MKRWSEGEGPRQPLGELPSGTGERNNGDVLTHSGVRGHASTQRSERSTRVSCGHSDATTVWEDRAFREGGDRTRREDSRGGGAGGVQCSQEVEGLGCEDLAAGFVETKAHPMGVSEGSRPLEPAGHSSLATGLQAYCIKPPGRGSVEARLKTQQKGLFSRAVVLQVWAPDQ